MDILSPISTMSSFFDTIEECKEENENGTPKLVQQRPFVTETKAEEESSWQNNNKKSIFSLSHIINAFGNNSFFNLKEIGSLTKIIDFSTIVDTKRIDTKQEKATAKENANENENEKEKEKERKIEKSEFLTLHIVGIRSIENKNNGSKNDKSTIDSFISEICRDGAAAAGDVGGNGLNERKEIDSSESKTDSNVARRIASVEMLEEEESSSEMKGAGMFAHDDSSSSSSDNEPLLRVNKDTQVESSSEMKGNMFGDSDSDSDSTRSNNDNDNENGRYRRYRRYRRPGDSSCSIPTGMWDTHDSSNEETENETDNHNHNHNHNDNHNNNNNNNNNNDNNSNKECEEEEESSGIQANIFGGNDSSSSGDSDDSVDSVFAVLVRGVGRQGQSSRSATPPMFGDDDSSSEESDDDDDDDDDDDEPRIVAVARQERQERQRRQVTPVAPLTATENEIVNNENEDKNTDSKTVFTACRSELCLKTINTNLTGNSTVKELKDYLRNNESFELDKYLIIELFYSNICLDDEYRTLGYYGIVNNSFLLSCVYEGLPLRKDDYEWEIQQIQKVIDGDKPSKFVSSYPASSINNGNTIDLLTAFTRRHVTNVQRGVTGESLAQANERRHMAEAKSEEREESKWHEIDFQEMSNDFKMEKISCLDVVTFMEEDNCVKMPCGHGMHPESLLAYILSEVNAQNTMDFYCPHLMKDEKTGSEKLCRAKWHYPIIKKVLLYAMNEEIERAFFDLESDKDVCIVAPESMIHCDGDPIKRDEDNNIELSSKRHGEILGNLDVKPLTEDALLLYEMKKKEIENKYLLNFMKIELLIARNILQEKFDAQTCGNCHSVLFRRISKKAMSMNDFQSVCPICTKEHRKQLIAENDIKIEKLRAKIAKLEKPKIVRTIKKVHKNLAFSKLSRRVRRLQNRLHRKKQNLHESFNNFKSKFDIKRYFNDSIEDIESKSLKYNELKSIGSKQHRLHHRHRRRGRRRRTIGENDIETSNVLTTVPTSFLDAFRDENDSSSSDDDRDNYLDAIDAKEKARAKAIRHEKLICKLKDIREKRIINPYLDYYDDLLDINMFGDNDIESPSEYDYVSDGYCSSSVSIVGKGLFNSDSDDSSAPNVKLFDNDDDSSDCNDIDVFNDDDDTLLSSSDDSSESISVHMSGDEKKKNNNVRAGNGYVFENDDNNNNGYSSSESESEGTQARRDIFNGNSSESESESDNEEKKNGKSKEEADSVKAVMKVKTEEEIKLERLKYELNYLVSRSFDNVKYSKYFCWGCGIAWKDVLSPSCGNSECHSSFRAQISSILRECDTKKVGSQSNVPSVRGCPKCGQLIHHWDACKHMECTQCQSYFCFVCLKRYVQDKGGWQCGSYSDKCPSGVHKRQTIDDLPSLNVASVKLFDFKAI